VGWRAVVALRQDLGADFARNATLLAKQRILTPISRELALSRRFAASDVLRQWLLNEQDPERKINFQREAEGYRQDFSDHSYFVVSTGSRGYYYADAEAPSIEQPRYYVDPTAAKDAWFFTSLQNTDDYNLNVDTDAALAVTKVWINVVTLEQGRKLAMSGTGLDLTQLLKQFLAEAEPGVTPIILNQDGYIQLHPDPQHIAGGSGAGARLEDKTLFRLIAPADAPAARAALAQARAAPAGVSMFAAMVDGREQLVTLSWLPELHWYVTSVVDMNVARVLDLHQLLPLAAAVLLMLLLLTGAFLYGINRMLVRPLLRLQASAQSVAAGDYDLALPAASSDEIGALTGAFGRMADTVRQHTRQLESTVAERTRELVAANEDMKAAHENIRSSIEYASLMQRMLLPDAALARRFGDRHSVLWLPRDVVGGDFYLFREHGGGFLLGVVDCAGHGVPGALATMLAWSALDNAMAKVGFNDPAAILRLADEAVRAIAPTEVQQLGLATVMDAALVWVEPDQQRARFAGAKLSAFVCSAGGVTEHKGARQALGDRRMGLFENTEFGLGEHSALHLVTDGLLDQSGGEKGYGFGRSRLVSLMASQLPAPLAAQHAAIRAALTSWQDGRPQRDDITLLSIRL